jgi:hypothetical protein
LCSGAGIFSLGQLPLGEGCLTIPHQCALFAPIDGYRNNHESLVGLSVTGEHMMDLYGK